MDKYEPFAITLDTLLGSDQPAYHATVALLQNNSLQKEGMDGKKLTALCKEKGLSLACALSLYLKSAFESFAREERSMQFGLFPLELYKLAEPAGRFEIFSPAIDDASTAAAETYGVDIANSSACLTNIVHNRFYLYDACFFKDKLESLLEKQVAADAQCDAVKMKGLLREKISLEKSCEIKSFHLLEAKATAIEIRTQFLARFPEYRIEFIVKTKAEVLGAVDKKLSSNRPVDKHFHRKLAELLCAQAGIEREMKNELDAGILERFVCRSPMDQELADHFHRQVIGEIKELLKYAHPDKWNPGSSDEELQNQIAEKSRQLVRFHELSRLGPGVMTFRLVNELQSWKKEFALLNPQAAQEAFRKSSGHSLEQEVKFWEASEQYLSTELEAILGNRELQNMRVILDSPDMHEAYERSIRNSITAMTHRIDQLMADPAIKEQWAAIKTEAQGISGRGHLIEELYG